MHATHYGGTGELYEKFISKIEYIDQMKTSCSWVQANGDDVVRLW